MRLCGLGKTPNHEQWWPFEDLGDGLQIKFTVKLRLPRRPSFRDLILL